MEKWLSMFLFTIFGKSNMQDITPPRQQRSPPLNTGYFFMSHETLPVYLLQWGKNYLVLKNQTM